jgi:hypothetical protein
LGVCRSAGWTTAAQPLDEPAQSSASDVVVTATTDLPGDCFDLPAARRSHDSRARSNRSATLTNIDETAEQPSSRPYQDREVKADPGPLDGGSDGYPLADRACRLGGGVRVHHRHASG